MACKEEQSGCQILWKRFHSRFRNAGEKNGWDLDLVAQRLGPQMVILPSQALPVERRAARLEA